MPVKLLMPAGFMLILDQFTKQAVVRSIPEGQAVSVTSWIKIRRVENTSGVPLSDRPMLLVFVWAVIFGGIYLIMRQGIFFQHVASQLGLGLALGGAGSNVFDQLRRGSVLDFLDLGFWPVFNLADMAIIIGITCALWSMV
jgi:signal peptidase II